MSKININALIVRLAEQEGVSSEALRKWRERGSVPHRWRLPLMAAAEAEGKIITVSAFDRFAECQSKAVACAEG